MEEDIFTFFLRDEKVITFWYINNYLHCKKYMLFNYLVIKYEYCKKTTSPNSPITILKYVKYLYKYTINPAYIFCWIIRESEHRWVWGVTLYVYEYVR